MDRTAGFGGKRRCGRRAMGINRTSRELAKGRRIHDGNHVDGDNTRNDHQICAHEEKSPKCNKPSSKRHAYTPRTPPSKPYSFPAAAPQASSRLSHTKPHKTTQIDM
ncbi:hypothetical protein DM02DRAFT_616459 [Periconia macrospinosa]|uniref:Uncharacterized protein n=1 Tax=Periconia macrospinosa TaxID=97972 RepID=A0A2V1DHF3_9PLEO|nr:hypothetical protein DM02DRAFT_616459 [Periconia macrospinosa]